MIARHAASVAPDAMPLFFTPFRCQRWLSPTPLMLHIRCHASFRHFAAAFTIAAVFIMTLLLLFYYDDFFDMLSRAIAITPMPFFAYYTLHDAARSAAKMRGNARC